MRDLPDDLLQLQRDLYAARAAVEALPLRRLMLSDGTVYREGAEVTDELEEREAGLWERCRTLSAAVNGHEFWAGFSGDDLPQARMALKQAAL